MPVEEKIKEMKSLDKINDPAFRAQIERMTQERIRLGLPAERPLSSGQGFDRSKSLRPAERPHLLRGIAFGFK